MATSFAVMMLVVKLVGQLLLMINRAHQLTVEKVVEDVCL
jgi:hypothetical protein